MQLSFSRAPRDMESQRTIGTSIGATRCEGYESGLSHIARAALTEGTQVKMDFDAVLKRARADLQIPTRDGEFDLYLWEHSVRVAFNCRRISKLDEVRTRSPDELALFAAALYHDSGWSNRCRSGEIDRLEVLLGPTPEAGHDIGANLLQQSLGGILDRDTLQRAVTAILTRSEKNPVTIEAQVLSDADHLEEFGLVSLWGVIRRGALDGKGVQAAIDVWKRKKEYQFWSARLADSFRFEAVRDVARKRLECFERFMNELAAENRGDDLPSLPDSMVANPMGQALRLHGGR